MAVRLGVGQLRAGDFTVSSLRARAQPPRAGDTDPRQANSGGRWGLGDCVFRVLTCTARASLRWSGVRGSWHVLQRALGSILALCQQGARQRGASVARDREAWASCGTNATARGVGVPSRGVLGRGSSSRALRVVLPVALGWLRATSARRVSRSANSHHAQGGQPLARPSPSTPGPPVSGHNGSSHAPPGPPCVGAACAAHGMGSSGPLA